MVSKAVAKLAQAAILFTSLVLSPGLNANRHCVDAWACTEIEQDQTGTTFWLSNNRAYPITVSLIVTASNMRSPYRSSKEFKETRVLEGFQREQVLTLFPKRSQRSSNYKYRLLFTPGDMHARHDSDYHYSYPFSEQARYTMVQGFGGFYSHRGASRYAVDFAMPEGSPIHAAREGTVIHMVDHNTLGGASRRYSRYANFIIILHADGTTGEYYHLRQHGVAVSVGQQVSAGEHIGYSGNTGFSSLPHLHFAVYRAKEYGEFESLPFRFSPN